MNSNKNHRIKVASKVSAPVRGLILSFFAIAMQVNPAWAIPGCTADLLEEQQCRKIMDGLLELKLEQLMNVEIQVATKTNETIFDAPSSVTVFTRQEIREMGVHSLEELLNFVPGFQTFRSGVINDSYMVAARGQSTAPTSYNILFLLDGQRLNDDLTGGALLFNRFITLANVKQVEVIRGPGSALYGTSAFTGVVNIVTETDLNEAYTAIGSFNGREFYTNLSRATGRNGEVSLFARYYTDDGARYGTDFTRHVNPAEDATRDPRDSAEFYLTWKWNKRLRINVRHMQSRLKDFTSFATITDGLTWTKNRHQFINFSYRLLDDKPWQLSVTGGYTEIKWESRFKRASSAFSSGAVNRQAEPYAGLEGSHFFSDKHQVLAGLIVRRPDLREYSLLSNAPTDGGEFVRMSTNAKIGTRTIGGVYFQDQFQINSALSTTSGIRYDYYSDFGGTLNPRAALAWSPGAGNTFKLMYGQAFRAPSKLQLGTESNLDPGNPNLSPETIETLELAWRKRYDNGYSGLTWFHSRTDDRIDSVPDSSTVVGARFANLSESLITSGLEMEAGIEIKGLRVKVGYTWLNDTEKEPRRTSEHAFSLITNYAYHKWNLNLSGYYFSEMEQFSLDRFGQQIRSCLDAYQVWQSAVRYAWNKDLSVVITVDNLFDADYASATTLTAFPDGLPNRGRTYFAGVEIRF